MAIHQPINSMTQRLLNNLQSLIFLSAMKSLLSYIIKETRLLGAWEWLTSSIHYSKLYSPPIFIMNQRAKEGKLPVTPSEVAGICFF